MNQTEKTLNSLDGMQRAAMPAVLRDRILAAIPGRAQIKSIRLGWSSMLAAAAGILLLLAANIVSLSGDRHALSQPGTTVVTSNPLSDDYFRPAPSI